MSLNVNDEMLAGNADADASYPDAVADDTDAESCIGIMSLCIK